MKRNENSAKNFWKPRKPFNNKVGGELAQIALTVMDNESTSEQRQKAIKLWWEQWLKDKQISLPKEEKLEKLLVRNHFAILITVLNDKLGFLVDYLNIIRGVG